MRELIDYFDGGLVYKNLHMNTIESVLPSGGYKSAHAPTMVEMEDGTLLLAWFAGTFEGDTDINIICSKLLPGEEKWSEPKIVSNDPERSDQNPSLFLGPDKRVWAMYTSQLGRVEGMDNMQFTSQIRCQKSIDGENWSDFETIFPEEGTFARQPIQILSNGRWIYGNWLCKDKINGLGDNTSAFKISDDEGKTWKHVDMPNSEGRVHPTVVELEDGKLIAFLRSRAADYIYKSYSDDYGDSWSEPVPTPLPNNNSSISAIKLESGRIALAYNHSSLKESERTGNSWPGLRCPVAVALSEDGGETWPLIRYFEMGEGYMGDENRSNNHQYEYPFIMQSKDKSIHLTYAFRNRISVKWVKFEENDVIGAKRGNKVYNPTSGKIE